MKHSYLQNKVVTALKEELPGIWYLNVHGGPMQRRGIPDCLFMYKGIGIAIEIKIDDDALSPVQKNEIREMMKAGWNCFVLNYKEKMYSLFHINVAEKGGWYLKYNTFNSIAGHIVEIIEEISTMSYTEGID